jgi:hypothetical protein
VIFSPDGAHIVTGSSDETVHVWHSQTRQQITPLVGHLDCVRCVAFSPDGAHIASGSEDRTARLWDVRTGKEIVVLGGHNDCMLSVVFSPDGLFVVSDSKDKTVRAWDVGTGKQLAVFDGEIRSAESVARDPKFFLGLRPSRNTERTILLHEQAYVRLFADASADTRRGVASPRPISLTSSFQSAAGGPLSTVEQSREPAPATGSPRLFDQSELQAAVATDVKKLRSCSPSTTFLHADDEDLAWNEEAGWISWRCSNDSCAWNLCWLPAERRGELFGYRGTTAIIGARQGAVTILHLSDAITIQKALIQKLIQ